MTKIARIQSVLNTFILTFQIFAVNTVLPMITLVYYNNSMPQSTSVLINLSLLIGTFVGQIVFGIAGDRFGRRRCYGYELIILTVSTVLMAICSKGVLQNENKTAWIVAWRFFMGIGIGGDYPLSATIVAEYVFLINSNLLQTPNRLLDSRPENTAAKCSQPSSTCKPSARSSATPSQSSPS
jgi:MFS family permease